MSDSKRCLSILRSKLCAELASFRITQSQYIRCGEPDSRSTPVSHGREQCSGVMDIKYYHGYVVMLYHSISPWMYPLNYHQMIIIACDYRQYIDCLSFYYRVNTNKPRKPTNSLRTLKEQSPRSRPLHSNSWVSIISPILRLQFLENLVCQCRDYCPLTSLFYFY